MYRNTATFPLAGLPVSDIKLRMLNWSQKFSILLFPDSNEYSSPYGRYECLLAAGQYGDAVTDLTSLQNVHDSRPDWWFGHIAYDYKNRLEPRLHSSHTANTGFPEFYFFCPQIVCYIDTAAATLTIAAVDAAPELVYAEIMQTPPFSAVPLQPVDFTQRVSEQAYLDTLAQLRRHITDGDCYEINYCCEAYATPAAADPYSIFYALNRLSPAPFAAFYRLGGQYMICASPERYLQKTGSKLLSQPIKGTARRDTDPVKDAKNKATLQASIKERAENVMIADLVRNDLARCCDTGSVQADELLGIYSFPQVHQMISTISGQLRMDLGFTDAIAGSFPMGSMTGAPKYMVMQLTEQYEQSRRELYSGTVGYISPDGDFDLNVVIRSLFYNSDTQYLSYHTGGAITYDSDALQEWEERNLKAWALERIFKP